jgi:hypothetical protein
MCKRIAGAVIEAIVSGKTFRVNPNYRNDNITPKGQNLNTEEQNNE